MDPGATGRRLALGPMGGFGNAASMFAVGTVIGAILVVAFVPETRGKRSKSFRPKLRHRPGLESHHRLRFARGAYSDISFEAAKLRYVL